MSFPRIAILHYSTPPVIGGVEAVIEAHARLFVESGHPLTVISGRGEAAALPSGLQLVWIPEMDTQHPAVLHQNQNLIRGEVPEDFNTLVESLRSRLSPILSEMDTTIVHNVFTKHFNLALTSALNHLVEEGRVKNCIAWCHDISWTSPNSRSCVHPGKPWEILRTPIPGVKYVVVSEKRQRELAGLFGCSPKQIEVIYNGVDPAQLLGLSPTGYQLATNLGLFGNDLVLLFPVRVTQAKNIEYGMRLLAALKDRELHPKIVLTGPPDPHDEESMAYFEQLLALRRELGVEDEMRFVFNSGPDPEEPFYIDSALVGELFRLSDVLLMPSHREGFGMPILEAGLVGIQVLSTPIPAAVEIGQEDVMIFDPSDDPAQVADRLVDWTNQNRIFKLRKRVRQNLTWQAIFQNQIEALIKEITGNHVALPG